MAIIQKGVSESEGAQEHVASKTYIAEAKDELKVVIAESTDELKAELRSMELRITLRLGGLMIGIAGVIIAIIVIERRFLS